MTTVEAGATGANHANAWQRVPLGDACEAVRGVTFNSSDASAYASEGSVACLTTSGVQQSLAWDSRRYIPRSKVSSSQLLVSGDILVSTANSKELVGKSCLVADVPFECAFGAFVTVLRPRSSVHPQYAAWWLRTKQFMDVCYVLSSNTTGISNLRVSDLLEVRIPLPPLADQRRIAATLDEHMAAIGLARVAAEQQLEAARALPSAYLCAVFESDEAKTWPMARLGDALVLRKDVVHPYNSPKGPATFVGLEHIESRTGVRTGSVEIEMSSLTGRKPQFFSGDIVYGYLRPYLNKVWLADFDGLCSVDQYVFDVREERAIPELLAWFMRSPSYLERAPIGTTPGQLPRIRTEEVLSVELGLPSLSQQQQVLSRLRAAIDTSNRIAGGIQAELDGLNSLVSSSLRAAFAGEL